VCHAQNQEPKEEICKETPHEDQVLVFAPTFYEVIQASIPPTQEEENVVSCFPLQIFDDDLFHDLENEEVLEEP
jgi:hypothetical protein